MEFRQFDTGKKVYDMNKKTLELNPWLNNYGYDHKTVRQFSHKQNHEIYKNEPKQAHGYPHTYYLQAFLFYACGLYTAKEQGIVKKGVYFKNFLAYHYFDYILFLRRSLLVAGLGGIVAGTLLFGDSDLAIKRIVMKYAHYKTPVQSFGTPQTTFLGKLS